MERINEDEGCCWKRKETERSTEEVSVSLSRPVFHIYVSGSRVLRAECEDRDR